MYYIGKRVNFKNNPLECFFDVCILCHNSVTCVNLCEYLSEYVSICIIEASELHNFNSHTIMYTVYSTYWGTVFNYISTMFSTVLSNVAQPDAFICNALSP